MDEMWDEGRPEREKVVAQDAKIAREWNAKEYEREGQSIECCCCFGEEAWEEMGACEEGHLVCRSCINTHVSVLLPTLSFPPPSDDTATPPLGTLIPCPSCIPPCAFSLPLSTLTSYLTPTNLKSYNSTISSAFSRSLLQNFSSPTSLSSSITAKKCPFCPYTILLPLPLPLLSSSEYTLFSPILLIHKSILFLVTTFLFPYLLTAPSSSLSLLAPVIAWRNISSHHDALVERTKLVSSGTIFRCHNMYGGSGFPDDEVCGRESCVGCGKEVWGGVACCDGTGKKVESVDGASVAAAAAGGEDEEEKSKEELRLAVERAMSEAMIRTCPKCELGFTKLDSCNKVGLFASFLLSFSYVRCD
jgi:hypothetical protein